MLLEMTRLRLCIQIQYSFLLSISFLQMSVGFLERGYSSHLYLLVRESVCVILKSSLDAHTCHYLVGTTFHMMMVHSS